MATDAGPPRERWPWFGVAAGGLLLVSTFMPFPEITSRSLREPNSSLVQKLSDNAATLYVRNGLSWFCVALLILFTAGLHRHLQRAAKQASLVPTVALGGGLTTAGALLVSYGLLAQIAGVASDARAPVVVASVYSVADGLAYGAWAGLGIVTGAVALAGLRGQGAGRGLAVFSAVVTVVFAAMAFFPFLAWLVAAVWLIIAGLAFGRDASAPRASEGPA